jgi:hypothetical protein
LGCPFIFSSMCMGMDVPRWLCGCALASAACAIEQPP